MMRGFCPRFFFYLEGAYVLMELCMEGFLYEGVLSEGGFVLPSCDYIRVFSSSCYILNIHTRQ